MSGTQYAISGRGRGGPGGPEYVALVAHVLFVTRGCAEIRSSRGCKSCSTVRSSFPNDFVSTGVSSCCAVDQRPMFHSRKVGGVLERLLLCASYELRWCSVRQNTDSCKVQQQCFQGHLFQSAWHLFQVPRQMQQDINRQCTARLPPQHSADTRRFLQASTYIMFMLWMTSS